MPFLKGISNIKYQISTNFKLKKKRNSLSNFGHWTFDIGHLTFRHGFSLIELMIVISLFGLATTLVTASYLKFEKAQRLKNAALQMVSDLRYVQNKATAQDKGASSGGGTTMCATNFTLGGWYLLLDSSASTSYAIGGDCINSSSTEPNEVRFYDSSQDQRTIKLPRDISVNSIRVTGTSVSSSFGQPVAFLFRPQKVGFSSHNGAIAVPAGTTLNFFNTDMTLANPMPGVPQNTSLTIELANSSGDLYRVEIQPNGEVNEVKP